MTICTYASGATFPANMKPDTSVLRQHTVIFDEITSVSLENQYTAVRIFTNPASIVFGLADELANLIVHIPRQLARLVERRTLWFRVDWIFGGLTTEVRTGIIRAHTFPPASPSYGWESRHHTGSASKCESWFVHSPTEIPLHSCHHVRGSCK